MRFLGLGLSDTVSDANTIWTFREALTRTTIGDVPAITVLFRAYEAALTRAGFLAMGGQIIDATIVSAPKQRNTDGEKADIRAGRVPEAWQDKPAKLAQKDRDARWTVKFSKANTASAVWADTAYRSKSNEQHLAESGLRSQIHRKKPAGRPMAKNVARANNARSKVRAGVEHVFACQKGPMALVVRTIGLARATVKIGLANLAYNMRRAVWLTSQRQARA